LLEKVGYLRPIELPPIEGSQQFNNAREQFEDLSGAIKDLLKESFQINELIINYLNARIKTRVPIFFLFKNLLAHLNNFNFSFIRTTWAKSLKL